MLGEGYSPLELEGPAAESLGEEGRCRKAVLPGDSLQDDSDPESSWSLRRIESSSAPLWFRLEAMGVDACKLGLGLSAVPTTSSSLSSVFETVLLSADILAGRG